MIPTLPADGLAGHDADFAFAGRDDAGAVGADQRCVALANELIDADHVEDGHAFGNGAYYLDAGIERFEDGVSREGGGTKIIVAFAPVFSTASMTVSNTGSPSTVSPALPGVTPPTICVPYSLQPLVWNAPALPVMPGK